MCCTPKGCCLGSPATQFGLLQAQIANSQATFATFAVQRPMAPIITPIVPLASVPLFVNAFSVGPSWLR